MRSDDADNDHNNGDKSNAHPPDVDQVAILELAHCHLAPAPPRSTAIEHSIIISSAMAGSTEVGPAQQGAHAAMLSTGMQTASQASHKQLISQTSLHNSLAGHLHLEARVLAVQGSIHVTRSLPAAAGGAEGGRGVCGAAASPAATAPVAGSAR